MKLRRASSLYSPRAAHFAGPLSSLLGEQHLVQLIRCIAVHLLGHMGIDVEGRTDVAVDQSALDGLDVDTVFNHLLAFSLGLRRGELAGLRWDDFDLQAGTVYIHHNRVVAGGKVIDKSPKSAAGTRILAIGPKLAAELAPYREKAAGPFVFSKKDGLPYNPESLSQKFHRFLQRQGLKEVRLHDLRHPYVKPTTKKYLFFLVPMIQLS